MTSPVATTTAFVSPMPTASSPTQRTIVLIGKESTGKSALAAALTGQSPTSTNIRGSTITCDRYQAGDQLLIDTPGILFRSDTATTRTALAQLQSHNGVVLIAKGTHIDEDLADLLPVGRWEARACGCHLLG